jgi:hypothetical protein
LTLAQRQQVRHAVRNKFKFLPLPPDFDPVDATVDEVASYRHESRWTVHKKIREGVYQSYLDGRIRKILFATVKADRERAMSVALTGKRRPGRPLKPTEANAPSEPAPAPAPGKRRARSLEDA